MGLLITIEEGNYYRFSIKTFTDRSDIELEGPQKLNTGAVISLFCKIGKSNL
jgi:hypothetical protein